MPGKYFSSKPFEFVFLDILQRKGKNTLVCDFVACPFTDNMQTRLKKLRLLIPFRHSKFHAERGIKLLKGLFAIHNSRPLKKTWHQMEYLIIKITVFNWLCFSLFLSFSGNSYWRTTNWLELMPYIITVLPNVAKSGLSPTLLASCESSIVPHSRLRIFHCSTSTMHECC